MTNWLCDPEISRILKFMKLVHCIPVYWWTNLFLIPFAALHTEFFEWKKKNIYPVT